MSKPISYLGCGIDAQKFNVKINSGLESIILERSFSKTDNGKKILVSTILVTNRASVLILNQNPEKADSGPKSRLYEYNYKINNSMLKVIKSAIEEKIIFSVGSLEYIEQIICNFIKSFALLEIEDEITKDTLEKRERELDARNSELTVGEIELERRQKALDDEILGFIAREEKFNKAKLPQEQIDAEKTTLDARAKQLDLTLEKLKLWAKKLSYEQEVLNEEKRKLAALNLDDLAALKI